MYDYIIVTHIPAFYKINLYNELAKKINIFVVFIASNTSERRADDFVAIERAQFNYKVLYSGSFQDRKVFTNLKSLRKVLKNLCYKKLLLCGWDLPEFWYLVFTNSKYKNCLALESTINESKATGRQALIKKIFLSRISKVFVSGSLHEELLVKLGYKGELIITKGVGIINKPNFSNNHKKYTKKFLYVGRLSAIKNLESLIMIFNSLSDYSLTIIGEGDQKQYLKGLAKKNIIFKDSIKNTKLKEEFMAHDIFILPSNVEPWGLVAEEALYFGLPVVISKNCGARDIISNGLNGYWVNSENHDEIKRVILDIDAEKYTQLIKGVKEFSIDSKDKQQVDAYI